MRPKISNFRVLPTENRARETDKYANLTLAQCAALSGVETGSGLKFSSFEAEYKDLRIRTLEK